MGWLKRLIFGEEKETDLLQQTYEMQKKADKAARIEGKHYLDLTERVKELKREKKHDEAISLLKRMINAVEREAKIRKAYGWDDFAAPWYYEQLAIVYRKEKRYDDEVAILERHQNVNNGKGSTKLAERLKKARVLRDKKSV